LLSGAEESRSILVSCYSAVKQLELKQGRGWLGEREVGGKRHIEEQARYVYGRSFDDYMPPRLANGFTVHHHPHSK
jgi:hypothetical protein